MGRPTTPYGVIGLSRFGVVERHGCLVVRNGREWPNSFMASECLTTFLPRERLFLRPALFPAKALNFNYLQHAPGWFGSRSSPESSSCNKPRSSGGAKQLCGVRPPLPLPGERTAIMSQVAPQKPLRTERRLSKAARSTPSRGDSLRPDDHAGIETHCVFRSA